VFYKPLVFEELKSYRRALKKQFVISKIRRRSPISNAAMQFVIIKLTRSPSHRLIAFLMVKTTR